MFWTREMDEKFEKLFAMKIEMKAVLEDKMEAGQEEMNVGQEEMKVRQEEMKAGLEKKMEAGQERMEQVQEEMKDLIRAGKEEMRAHVAGHVVGIKDHVDGCLERMEEEVQGVKGKIEEVKTEVQEKKRPREKTKQFPGKSRIHVLAANSKTLDIRRANIIERQTFEEHLNNFRKVFQRLQKANLKLNPKKCRFFQKEVAYLGHVISAEGVKTDRENIKAIVDWPRSDKIYDLRSFLGLCTYYRRFVKNFSTIARPLHKLTEAKSNFNWTDECEKSFNSLKQALTSSPILTYPRTDKDFIFYTDASNEGIGAVLSQNTGNEERVIAYFRKSLGKPERNYCVTRKELLAIVKSIEHFHHYLYGRKFLLRTDHASLRWLLNFKEPEGQIARWIQRLQEYDFEIQHRKGTSHGNADALSRRPCKESCKQCTNAEKKFGMETDISVKVLTTTTVDPWSFM
ncbi:Retrovirus-related Pol polyprotein from transposon 297 [Araneus ventricosus]|uniref:RNA-directed DNA polymerase n=1 Tax=Araneus ventricosus TaxID=182803 RepID=A0A4Y2LTM0_ARAVE|nr:Retrovirus-related Pol polyprotein from transposon 297 [Araneus ventricosus]